MEREEMERITREMDDLLNSASVAAKHKNPAAVPQEASTKEEIQMQTNEPEINPVDEILEAGDECIIAEEFPNSGKERARSRRARSMTGPFRFFHPRSGLAAAFLVPVFVMIIVFIQRGIFPFGEMSFLRTDMYHQYAPFFSEFHYKLTHGENLLYSWHVGMGVNFSALYAYYLASPLNWLLVFCPKGLIIEFMTYAIVLKIGLSGFTFAYYLRRHFYTRDFGVAFFGIFYALSGYMAAYSWNIMWLDCILLFPLILLGLEQLVEEKKGLLYCVTLGIAIVSNYYISIMICIFMVIYFLSLLVLKRRGRLAEYGADGLRFAVYSLAAGGISAAVLLPAYYALGMTASADWEFPKDLTSYFSIFDMLARHIGNVETEIGLDHWPNIYCGVAVLMFFLLYLGCKKIRVKEKAVYCALLLLFFASFSLNMLNFIWHGFHYPNSLPCRQSFIYIALLLFMCYQVYANLGEIPWKHVALAFWGAVTFVLLAQKLVTQPHFYSNGLVYYGAILFLAVYAGLIYLVKQGRVNTKLAALLALGVVFLEAAVNTTVTSVTTVNRTNYVEDNQDVGQLLLDYGDESGFWRVDKVPQKTKNDGAWMQFPSVSTFSSTANESLSKFFKWVGCESSTNAYSITGGTPLIDMLFSIRYRLYDSEQTEAGGKYLAGAAGETYLYENSYTLPLGFLAPDEFVTGWQTDLGNPADVQNNLAELLGASPVLEKVEGVTNGSQFTCTTSQAGEYYAYVTNSRVKKVKATINDWSKDYDNVNRGYFLELGYQDAGVAIELNGEEKDEQLTAVVYRFSEDSLTRMYEALSQVPIEISRTASNRVEGRVKAVEAGTMFFSIPYDKGWTVMVDGQRRDTFKIHNTFMGFYVSEGTHTITMTYEPEGLKAGMAITGVSLLFVLTVALSGILAKRKLRKKYETRSEEA